MSIRLGKAISELNIGLQTAVEFLEKKSELGEVKAEPTFKLNDAQYQALVKAFHKDKEVRNQADKLFPKKTKGKKRAAEDKDHRAETVLNAGKQQYKPLGKIKVPRRNLMLKPFKTIRKKLSLLPWARFRARQRFLLRNKRRLRRWKRLTKRLKRLSKSPK